MMADDELEALLHRYIDGCITAEDMTRLNAWLRDDADARREFAELLNVDSALAAAFADDCRGSLREPAACSPSPQPNSMPLRQAKRNVPTRSRSQRRLWLAAACLMLLASGAWWWQSQRVLATVAKDAGVEELPSGTKLRRERHKLTAGAVELITARAARVVIEAPAEFQFESAQRLRLLRGRLAADVPPSAKGFTVVTPSGDAVDLGTRFGVDVPVSGAAEVHVFQGEVIAKSHGAKARQNLRGGDAVTFEHGASTSRELRSSAFIQPDEMPQLTAGLAAGQRARAEATLAALKREPARIALLDFESDDALAGDFRWVQGRWPGSRAAEFVNVGDHLKLDVGGERDWPRLTLAAWVRLDRLGAPYQSLLHTDGWSKSPGQVHWMVTRHTTMRLALFGNTLAADSDERELYPDSRTSVLPEQGRWVHLAVVYDSAARTVRFFLNGQFDKETRQEIAHPARLGSAQIGNWDRQDRKLSGRIDELILLGRAMGDDEVRALFEAGSPYR